MSLPSHCDWSRTCLKGPSKSGSRTAGSGNDHSTENCRNKNEEEVMPFDAFLKIETPNITGESTDSKHKGEIEIYSFSLGASNPTTIGSATGGAGAGKVSLSSFNFM